MLKIKLFNSNKEYTLSPPPYKILYTAVQNAIHSRSVTLYTAVQKSEWRR